MRERAVFEVISEVGGHLINSGESQYEVQMGTIAFIQARRWCQWHYFSRSWFFRLSFLLPFVVALTLAGSTGSVDDRTVAMNAALGFGIGGMFLWLCSMFASIFCLIAWHNHERTAKYFAVDVDEALGVNGSEFKRVGKDVLKLRERIEET